MRKAEKLAFLLLLIMISDVLCAPAIAQGGTASTTFQGCSDISEEYWHALDVVFPRPVLSPTDFRNVRYRIVLRYEPSRGPESQMIFERRVDGSLIATEYALPDGVLSIWARLWKVYEARRCPTDADFATKLVIKRLDPAPKEVSQMVTELFQQPFTLMIDPDMRSDLNPKSQRLMVEDGAAYHFWLDGSQDSALFRLHDGPLQSPLYDKIDRLRSAVENAK